MSFPSYPNYKESGVEWLGHVPDHWEVNRLRFICEINPRKSEASILGEETIVSFLPMDAIGEDGSLNLEQEKRLADVLTGYTYFREGDVTLAKITPCFENGKGAIMRGLTNGVGFGTTELIVARPRAQKTSARFLQYLFGSRTFRSLGEAHMYGAGGQKRVPDEFIREYKAGIPSLVDQNAIADFLDSETAKIDQLVAEQQKLIELLKEKRQAVISHAVTKGLHPDAPMRDSGIEWLGQVPEHWEVRRLKTILEEPLKYGANEAADIDDPNLPRFVRITDIDQNGLLRDDTFKSLPFAIAKEYLLKEGDILLARSGATVGKSFIYSDSWGIACYAGYLIRARLNQRKCLAKWLYLYCQTNQYWSHVVGTQIQATIQNVSAEKYASLSVPLPTTEIQSVIISYLDAELLKADTLITEAQHAITLLQERRSALISAAVTGQIDVRTQPQN